MLSEPQKAIGQMFENIARTYDRVNRLVSLGLDARWRKLLVERLPPEGSLEVLDAATGTADLLIAMCKLRPNIKKAVGVDISENMLLKADEKIRRLELSSRIALAKADVCDLPFPALSFDVVSIAFGIRNVVEVDRALGQFARVLKEKGSLLILEFSLPPNRVIRHLYLWYFRHILPLIGGWLSKDYNAYRYLNRSVEAFPSQHDFQQIILRNGFNSVLSTSLSFGVATIYCARKI